MKLTIYNIMCITDYAQGCHSSTRIRRQLVPKWLNDENLRIALALAHNIACEDLLKDKNSLIKRGVNIEDLPSMPLYQDGHYLYDIPDWFGKDYYVEISEVDLSFSPCIFARDEFEDYDTSHLSNKDVEAMVEDAEEMVWNNEDFLCAFNAVKQRIIEEYKLTKKY